MGGILQNINTKLAQGGMNMQVPVPKADAPVASGFGGMLKRWGLGDGAAAAFGAPQPGVSAPQSQPTTGMVHSQTRTAGISTAKSSSPARAATSQSLTSQSTITPTSTSSLPLPCEDVPLKRVQFTVSSMCVTYPISNMYTPGSEDVTRKKVEREHRKKLSERRRKRWTLKELEALYRECCRTREELPLKKMRFVFQEAAEGHRQANGGEGAGRDGPLKTLDLSFLPLDRAAIDPLADLLSVDFGLTKLVLENCGLTDDGLKAILHGLLISGTLPNLSLAANKKIKYNGWRYVSGFIRRAQALRYLDLSENNITRPALELLVSSLVKSQSTLLELKAKASETKMADGASEAGRGKASIEAEEGELDEDGLPLMPGAPLLRNVAEDGVSLSSSIISLRLENCALKSPTTLEILANAVRFSTLKHISIRRNRIGQAGCLPLANLLKDYPDSYGATAVQGGNVISNPTGSNAQQDVNGVGLGSFRTVSPELPEGPIVVSSPAGGITSRKIPTAHRTASLQLDAEATVNRQSGSTFDPQRRTTSNAYNVPEVTLLQAKKAKQLLAEAPRMGSLLTLDLKSNDIRGGVVNLAQALKKNRTLKVLNLSDNNLDVAGLVSIADALKYNPILETLDVSRNPCSGPSIQGITTLRTAFTLNSNLKRLFLNDTDLPPEGAIALAEFLPEAKSLIHLDLTENFEIDIAGVMALSVSLKMNRSLRCLDINIPPNNRDFARLSQEILQSCVRNTEIAQQKANQRGLKQPIPAPIYKSVVAKAAAQEQGERQKAIAAAQQAAKAHRQDVDELVQSAAQCRDVLRTLLESETARLQPSEGFEPASDLPDVVEDLMRESLKIKGRLVRVIDGMEEGRLLERVLALNDDLESLTTHVGKLYKLVQPLAQGRQDPLSVSIKEPQSNDLLKTPAIDATLSSPTFSIGSDDEDDADPTKSGAPHADTDEPRALREQVIELKINTGAASKARSDGDGLSPVEQKAKGFLSEEGELFRKAKALSIDDNTEDVEEHGVQEEGAPAARAGRSGREDDLLAPPKHGRSRSGSSSSTSSVGASVDAGPSVSGEDLRAELLGVDIPKSHSRASSDDSTSKPEATEQN
ncbi:RNI-like protein [Tilletiaria anomala UBC 951]|uniref:RNI-like protein n=1 Tax=Tilletiaria anomala (strain ATCC 24038 / CBS 436.72 / UBC 951) TaxID=1037660 RepID=A0A066V8C3_TILAU|nr:RNI-like protein [Tilletiaria anomala UBC 951]KDN36543.1 RNI-like protein [Tilletiaria anomala UBC 951]